MDIFAELAYEELKQKQALPLDEKIKYAKLKIHEFVERLDGEKSGYALYHKYFKRG